MKRIGLYGGTFSPLHFGHLSLATQLMEKRSLDEVWWIPAARSPFRFYDSKEVSVQDRLAMLALGIADFPRFKLLDCAIKQPSPSYMIDTLRELVSAYPQDKFFLLMGDDLLERFMEWKEVGEIIEKSTLLIGSRINELQQPVFPKPIEAVVSTGRVLTKHVAVSSTEVRNRLKARLYCGHLLPTKILDFIYANRIYLTN